MQLLNELPGHSRVWIYLAERALTPQEAEALKIKIRQFCDGWSTHGNDLNSDGDILHQRFLVLAVDEKRAGASGCSIDKSLHFIGNLEKEFNVTFTNRLLVAYKNANDIETFTLSTIGDMASKGLITPDTIIFDNLVPTLQGLRTRWETPLKNTWLLRFLPTEVIHSGS